MLPLLLSTALAGPIPVTVAATPTGWTLLRDGVPVEVRGAGGTHALDTLAAIGGNSVRTWGTGPETRALLDEAHAQGLTVAVGLWLGHRRHGFDYQDRRQVSAQLDALTHAVASLKDHPAILLWGVGNEMEGFASGDDPAIWGAVCEVAAMVQEQDPHHPVMTTTADIGGGRVAAVQACPHIDIHGVNSYGGAPSLPERYRAAGGQKPLLLTEYGPPGVWELDRTPFGASPEPTSSEKAATTARVWTETIAQDPLMLGAYAFLWGWKTEATATWYGLFLPDGTRLGTVDALADAWGHPVPDRAPSVGPLQLVVGDGGSDAQPGVVQPGERVEVAWSVEDPEGGPLETRWTLRRDIAEQSTGGDVQALPAALPGVVLEASTTTATLRMPRAHGTHRLYAEVRDGAGGGATASLPLLVGRPRRADEPLPMPWFVYQDEGVGGPWVPSGHMGAVDALTLDLGWTQDCASPPTCIRVQTSSSDWTGVAWQTPANNWGDQPGGVDLSEARWLRFKVKGTFGWERMTAGVGLIGPDKPHADSLRSERDIDITTEWQDVRIRLRGDRSQVITGFWWVLPNQRPATITIDDVVFE